MWGHEKGERKGDEGEKEEMGKKGRKETLVGKKRVGKEKIGGNMDVKEGKKV